MLDSLPEESLKCAEAMFGSPSPVVFERYIDVALRDMVRSGLVSAGLMVGLNDLRDLFQSK